MNSIVLLRRAAGLSHDPVPTPWNSPKLTPFPVTYPCATHSIWLAARNEIVTKRINQKFTGAVPRRYYKFCSASSFCGTYKAIIIYFKLTPTDYYNNYERQTFFATNFAPLRFPSPAFFHVLYEDVWMTNYCGHFPMKSKTLTNLISQNSRLN